MSDPRFLLAATTAPLDLEGAQRRYLAALLDKCAWCPPPSGVEWSKPAVGAPMCTKCRSELVPKCLACGSSEGVDLESSRTAYPFEGARGSDEDPNRPIPLCRPCAKRHHQEWDDRWAELRAGQM